LAAVIRHAEPGEVVVETYFLAQEEYTSKWYYAQDAGTKRFRTGTLTPPLDNVLREVFESKIGVGSACVSDNSIRFVCNSDFNLDNVLATIEEVLESKGIKLLP
jgi:hypothetical protein